MRNQLIAAIIGPLAQILFGMLTPEVIKRAVDSGLDIIEAAVKRSSNTIDDAVALAACKAIRASFNIPDYDNAGAGQFDGVAGDGLAGAMAEVGRGYPEIIGGPKKVDGRWVDGD